MKHSTGPGRTYNRGDRLHPSRFSRLYWSLTRLRMAFEHALDSYVIGGAFQSVVDYGCGNMPYRPLLTSRIPTYIPCDLPGNPDAAHAIDPAGRLPLSDASVDLVFSSQVLEHVGDPALYLAECRRVLRAHGLVVLSTHGVWRYHPDPTDYWRWTSDGLRKVIAEAGFEVRHFRGELGPPAYALQILQDSAAALLPAFAHPLFFALMQLLVEAADRACPTSIRDKDACIFVVVAAPVHQAPEDDAAGA